jgi:hypothetical protein
MGRALKLGVSRGKIIPNDFFGTHFSKSLIPGYRAPTIPLHDFGQGVVRLWDDGITWRRVEPTTKGQFSWVLFDALVDKVWSAGQKIIYCPGLSPPDWASTIVYPTDGDINANPPNNVQDAADFITAVINRYGSKIEAVEPVNEPNTTGYRYWNGTIAQLASVQAAVYDAIKAANPAIKVCSPPISGIAGIVYLSQFLSLIASKIDVVSVHSYCAPSQPEEILTYFDQIRCEMKRAGVSNLPLWSTECGYGDYYVGTTLVTGTPMSQDMASSYIARIVLCSWLGGAERVVQYAVDQGFSTIRMVDFVTPSIVLASGVALKFVLDTLKGGTLSNYRDVGGLSKASFSTSLGRSGNVFWSRDAQTSVVDLSAFSACYDVYGTPVSPISNAAVLNLPVFAFY